MGNSYSTDHKAEDHMHTDITCKIEEPQQKYRLGKVNNILLGGRGGAGLKLVLLDLNLALCFRCHSSQPNNYHKFNIPT